MWLRGTNSHESGSPLHLVSATKSLSPGELARKYFGLGLGSVTTHWHQQEHQGHYKMLLCPAWLRGKPSSSTSSLHSGIHPPEMEVCKFSEDSMWLPMWQDNKQSHTQSSDSMEFHCTGVCAGWVFSWETLQHYGYASKWWLTSVFACAPCPAFSADWSGTHAGCRCTPAASPSALSTAPRCLDDLLAPRSDTCTDPEWNSFNMSTCGPCPLQISSLV